MLNSVHYLKYRLKMAAPLTETTVAERDCLRRYATGKMRLVEVGVFQGVNTSAFRKGMHREGVIIAVDPFRRFFFGIRGFGWARKIAHREVEQIHNGRVIWIERLGEEAPLLDEVKPFLPVDFIFMDGDHSYEGLRGDWLAWKAHVAANGIVALHDSRCRHGCGSEQFTQAVILKDPGFKLMEEIDSLTVLKRNP
jgi:hypothetical protein